MVTEDSVNNTINLIANDTDPDGGDTITISGILTTPINGTLSISGTTNVLYTPNANFCGTDVFTYQAVDTF
jgi:large repetitive protein